MTKIEEITLFIESIAPLSIAESWDNVGLMLGKANREVNKIMLCLDATHEACKYASEKSVDLIISHHPFIFSGIKKLNDDCQQFDSIELLLKNNIAVYSAHTNLDSASRGVNSTLAERIGLISDSDEIGLGRWGSLEVQQTLKELIETVKNNLNANIIRVIGKYEGKINRTGVFCGSFDGDFSVFSKHNLDVLVTGEIKYHDAINAVNFGHCLIDAGHFNTEKIIIDKLLKHIKDAFPKLEVIRYELETDPFIYY